MGTFRMPDSAMLNPNLTHAWINIQKNANSFCQKVFSDLGWKTCTQVDFSQAIVNCRSIPKLVILRDPVQRWISGFAETFGYWNTDRKNENNSCHFTDIDLNKVSDLLTNSAFWEMVYLNPVFDVHTEFQHEFLNHAENVTYIKIDRNDAPNLFYKRLSNYLESIGEVSNFSNWTVATNTVDNNKDKHKIYQTIKDLMLENSEIERRLRLVYKKDYWLFDRHKQFEV